MMRPCIRLTVRLAGALAPTAVLLVACGGSGSAPPPIQGAADGSSRGVAAAASRDGGPNRCGLLTDSEVQAAIGPHGPGTSGIETNEYGLQSCRWAATATPKGPGVPEDGSIRSRSPCSTKTWNRGPANGPAANRSRASAAARDTTRPTASCGSTAQAIASAWSKHAPPSRRTGRTSPATRRPRARPREVAYMCWRSSRPSEWRDPRSSRCPLKGKSMIRNSRQDGNSAPLWCCRSGICPARWRASDPAVRRAHDCDGHQPVDRRLRINQDSRIGDRE